MCMICLLSLCPEGFYIKLCIHPRESSDFNSSLKTEINALLQSKKEGKYQKCTFIIEKINLKICTLSSSNLKCETYPPLFLYQSKIFMKMNTTSYDI